MPQLSIVIRTLNEGRYLASLLKGIHSQVTDLSYEIILIDSGSTDNTLQIAETYSCRILHIKREDFSFGRSLNIACDASYGQYLIIISGHCIPADNFWLQKLTDPIINKDVDYSYGRQVGGQDTYWSESQIFKKYFPSKSSIPQVGFYCNNANSAISRSVWNKYRFNEDLTGLEDMYLAKQIVADGGIVGYVSDAIVLHLHHESWRQVQRRFEREAFALQYIFPDLILRRRDIFRFFLVAVLSDISTAFPSDLSFNNIKHIFRYRFYQYIGSYRGNHTSRVAGKKLREDYFYPKP